MLRIRKREHIEKLLDELSEVRVEVQDPENESYYFVDYLYGVSDIAEGVEEFLEEKKEDKWVLFYRVLISKEILENKEYNRFSKEKDTYFLMRTSEDLKRFIDFYENNRNEVLVTYRNKIDTIFNKYKNSIEDGKTAEKFKQFLESFIINEENDGTSEYRKATYDLGEFIKKNSKILKFNQGKFFKEELGFKNNNKYSGIVKKYKEERNV